MSPVPKASQATWHTHTANTYTHMCMYVLCLLPPRSCCYARSNLLPSCTNAVSTKFIGSADNLCPAPPKLPPTTGSTSLQGPLQDKGAFVAEYLLHLSTQETPLIFFNHFQGGFVVSPRDPAFSVCSSPDPVQTNKSFIDPVLGALQGVTCSGDSSELSLNLFPCFNCFNYYKPNSTCPSPSSTPSPLPSCYSVDASSATCFQNKTCPFPESGGGVSATYVPQVDDVAITVWYNNVVSNASHYIRDCPQDNATHYIRDCPQDNATHYIMDCPKTRCPITSSMYMCRCSSMWLVYSHTYAFTCTDSKLCTLITAHHLFLLLPSPSTCLQLPSMLSIT